jgi:integrase
MGRGRVSKAAPGADDTHPAQGRAPTQAAARGRPTGGLVVVERAGHWYIHGTISVRGCSRRVRRGTGLPARPEFREAAEHIKRQVENDFVDEVVHGIKPSAPVGVAARKYLGLDKDGHKIAGQGEKVSLGDLKILQAAIREFGARQVNTLSGGEWLEWAQRENTGNLPNTLVRYLSPIKTFLRWCASPARGWLTSIPPIDLPKLPRQRHRQRRRVAELHPELLVFLFDYAAPHLKAQLYTEWSTGARVSSILLGCRLCDLILAEERSQITFHDTKNGDPVTAYLHPAAAEVIADYLELRGGLDRREEPLFLTDRNRPYSAKPRTGGFSGTNKTAWHGMVRRAVKARRRLAAEARVVGERQRARELWAEATLLRRVTQHWLRHWFATHSQAIGMDLRSIGEQGGWRDYRSIQGYSHDVPEVRRRWVDSLPIGGTGTHLTQSSDRAKISK